MFKHKMQTTIVTKGTDARHYNCCSSVKNKNVISFSKK